MNFIMFKLNPDLLSTKQRLILTQTVDYYVTENDIYQ